MIFAQKLRIVILKLKKHYSYKKKDVFSLK